MGRGKCKVDPSAQAADHQTLIEEANLKQAHVEIMRMNKCFFQEGLKRLHELQVPKGGTKAIKSENMEGARGDGDLKEEPNGHIETIQGK